MLYKLLILNLKSKSTQISVFEDELLLFEETLRHTSDELRKFDIIYNQFQFRKDLILKYLFDKKFDIKSVDAVVSIGGLLKPVESGTYTINEKMLEDLKIGVQGQHASNLGRIIASELAATCNALSFIVDPVIVDELEEVARIPSVPKIELSEKKYEELSLIVEHISGGVCVGIHENGRVIDVNNALDGEGPFSQERSGGVPMGDLHRICYNREYFSW